MMLRQRRARISSPKHIAFIRELPSLIPGPGSIDAAHVRYGDLRYGKGITGMGEKPGDNWTVPLAHTVHMAQHARGEREWWAEQEIDPIIVAAFLWAHSGDYEAGLTILRNAHLFSLRRAA